MNQLLIFTPQTSNRLTYTFDLMIKDLLGLSYELTNNHDYFFNYTGAKFSYAPQPVTDEIFFESATLLFETDIAPQPINFCTHGKIKGFYPCRNKSAIPFDIFASAFFLVTRYEEYLSSQKDKYDRYRGSQSMNFKGGFLEKPMVNFYVNELRAILKSKFPDLPFVQPRFEYVATFDIDMVYSYREKGFKRNLGGFVRSLFLSDFREFKERLLVLAGKWKDPFDTYDYIFERCGQYSIRTIFFFLLADKSRFDKNISHQNKTLRSLIKDIAMRTATGIHLSFRSHISSEITSEEIQRMADITDAKVIRNRYHYLRFSLPGSYQRLVQLGITEDYSMAYAPRIGFRAGICTPFYFFNLKKNETSALQIYPVAFMDATFSHYNNITAEESLHKIREVMGYVKEVEGLMIGLWHNSTFSESKEWKGWRRVFETVAVEAHQLTQLP